AISLVRCATPAFAAPYAAAPGHPTIPHSEAILTITPPACFNICRKANFEQRKTLFKLTFSTLSQSSSARSATLSGRPMSQKPALLTSILSLLYLDTTSPIILSTSGDLLTSPTRYSAFPPAFLIISTVCDARLSSRSTTHTLAP